MDFCSKKRLVAGAGVCAVVTLVTVTLQSHWFYTSQLKQQLLARQAKANSSCGNQGLIDLSACERCPREEMRNEEPHCMETGYKKKVKCADGTITYNWCDISPAVEERQFWIFELCAFLIGAVSYTVVYLRQRKNDKLLMDKINRQIGLTE